MKSQIKICIFRQEHPSQRDEYVPPVPPIFVPQDPVSESRSNLPKVLGSIGGLKDWFDDLSLGRLTGGQALKGIGNLLGGMDYSKKLDLPGSIGDLDLNRFGMSFYIFDS